MLSFDDVDVTLYATFIKKKKKKIDSLWWLCTQILKNVAGKQ